MSELQGKAAVVTGGSRGIGAATAKILAARGASVVVAARSAAKLDKVVEEIKAAGGLAIGCECDVSDYEDVESAVEMCRLGFGSVDILVNNAGVIEPVARLADSDPDAWGKAIDINVKGVYHGLRAAIPVMEAAGGGVVVNISSGAANRPLEGWSHYCASKAAALMLTQSAHLEVAEHGVRVVGLSPGTVATDMQVVIKASGINPVSQLDPSAHIPAEWVGRAIAWLCTDDAREFDGGDVSLREPEIRRRVGLPV